LQKLALTALHGFLGDGLDWGPLRANFDSQSTSWSCPDLSPNDFDRQNLSLGDWAKEFLSKELQSNRTESGVKRILIGYSMGGRLGLHILKEQLERSVSYFDAFIFVSTHFGLDSEDERRARVQSDIQWAQRFTSQDWDELMKSWNSQAALATSTELKRQESRKLREACALQMQSWSLGQMENFKSLIENSKVPVLWITGSEDSKFVSLARQLNGNKLQFAEISGCGHRVPMEAADKMSVSIKNWLSTLRPQS
jgi:2-succinyl-6-hydroxy-2,4-cyclohexadiene-1-carboxylate synthase